MDNDGLSTLSFEQILVFLAAARYENFTRASETLGMSQSNVSHTIDRLEKNLGLILFIRDRQRVRLSPAGKALFEAWTKMAEMAQDSLDHAHTIQQGTIKQLRIGDYDTTVEECYLLPILSAYEKLEPNVSVKVSRLDPANVLEGLTTGKFDIVFFSKSGANLVKKTGAKVRTFRNLKPCIVLSRSNKLFEKPEIKLSDLSGETLVAMKTTGPYEEYWKSVESLIASLGIKFKDIVYADNPYTMAFELKHNQCIALMDRFYRPFEYKDLRYIELEDADPVYGFLVAYMPNNQNPLIKAFVKTAISVGKSL